MAFEVGAVIARIQADLTGFKKGIQDAKDTSAGLGSALSGVGDTIASVGKQAAIFTGIVGGGVVLAAKASVDAFNESAVAMEQTKAVLISTGGAAGVTADQIDELTASMQENTPISDEASRSAANMLLTFTNIGKDVFDKTAITVADMATAMNGGGTPSMEQMRNQAMQLGKALQDPDTGLGALHRVGVNVEDLKKKFTDSMPIQEKQKLILQELGSEFGGSAARATETFAGQMQMLGNKVNDIQEKIGGLITQALMPLVDWFDDIVSSDQVTTLLEQLTAAFNSLMPILKQVGDWISTHQELVKTFLEGLAIGLGALLVIGTITILITTLLNPMTLLVAAIIGLYMAWKNNFLGLRDITDSVVREITSFFNNYLIPLIQAFSKWWNEHWEFIKIILQGAWESIKGVITVAWAIIYGILKVGIDLLTGNWKQAWQDIQDMFKNAWNGIVNMLKGMIDFIDGWAGLIVSHFTQPFKDAWNEIQDTVNKIKDALDFTKRHSPSVVDIVKNGVNQVNDAISQLAFSNNFSLTPAQQLSSFSDGINNSSNIGAVHVHLDGAIIADSASAGQIGEKIGDGIISKLKTNIRF